MKKETSMILALKKITLIVSILFTLVISSTAQFNASYNSNTIPIGGASSTAFGHGVLSQNTGTGNTGIGTFALNGNTTGSYNTAIGRYTLTVNTTGDNNTANGDRALSLNSTGYENVAVGVQALYANIDGVDNTANGYQALYNNISGSYNTTSGSQALFSNSTGLGNIANGYYALYNNISGNSNTANGSYVLASNTTGNNNTANGSNALFHNTTGNFNIGNGTFALRFNTTGSYNNAYGNFALRSNASGSYNVALGDSAGFKSLGNGNIYLGNKAGYNETGSNKIYIGNDSNKTIIYGDLATGQVLLGNKQPTGYTFKGKRTLNVVGGIITDSMRVALVNGWADHVFSNDYYLKPLSDLESYIHDNNHLPGIPSANEVATKGIDLAEMNSKLLEKIEELTLYVLQQQKQLLKQQLDIDELKRSAVK